MAARPLSRRAFLAGCAAATGMSPVWLDAQRGRRTPDPLTASDSHVARLGARLRERFPDLRRHFIFEYYPWYGTSPWRHWDGSGRTPPAEISAAEMPLLGAYDSRSARVIEQHAQWIAASGVGAVNLSWWGRGSYEDESTHIVMDVMRAFDIKVTFHLEPYSGRRGVQYADDVLYLVREYGDRRRWDSMLLLRDADGHEGPVFKSFVTLLSPTNTNCQGVTSPNDLFVADDVWRQQVTRLRGETAGAFDRIFLMADSLDAARTQAIGFDAGAVGNPYIRPPQWPPLLEPFDRRGIPFSFAVNAGFDNVEPKVRPTDPCYRPAAFEPAFDVRWDVAASREAAHRLCGDRITQAFERTLAHQADAGSASWRTGFLLVPINSFNEWHEGTAFEPMKSYLDLTEAERRLYHNPVNGSYRLAAVQRLMSLIQ
jgi:glycosyl hydrolase family 99